MNAVAKVYGSYKLLKTVRFFGPPCIRTVCYNEHLEQHRSEYCKGKGLCPFSELLVRQLPVKFVILIKICVNLHH